VINRRSKKTKKEGKMAISKSKVWCSSCHKKVDWEKAWVDDTFTCPACGTSFTPQEIEEIYLRARVRLEEALVLAHKVLDEQNLP
jgi:predicted RNA-binding Zn-ribbon protein involved in translation (DUF1610 family)